MGSKPTNKQHIDESNRCIGCLKPCCKQACPIGNDIPGFLQYVRNGEYDKAVALIGHPFGEICGYVCPHEQQCQGSCVLGKKGQAVQMGAVERAVFAQHPYRVERKVRPGSKSNGLKVAVIGGGVSGITLAVKLYEQGADVTVFERDRLLSTLKLIPDFRLPREAIDRVLTSIDGKFTVVKKDVNFEDIFVRKTNPYQSKSQRELYKDELQLVHDYDAVYLSTGASVLYKLGVEGEELATPYDEFLKSSQHTGKVVVIGGGNTAMDCARLAKRFGCDVTVAYRRQRADMPAFAREIAEAENEDVKLVYNVAPVLLKKNGGKLHLTLAKTVSEGRGKLTVTDETTTVECDTVVSALGSKFDKDNLYGAFYASLIDDAKPQNPFNPRFNLYVGGDVLGASTVSNAVADGLKVAHTILKDYTKTR